MSDPAFTRPARAFLAWRRREQTRNDPRFSWHEQKPPKRDDGLSDRYFRNAAAFTLNLRLWP